jgi:hypothetical protein
MIDEESKAKINALSIDELKENLARKIYGADDSEKARYASYVIEVKERVQAEIKFTNLVLSVQDSGIKIAKFIDKLIDNLKGQTDKIIKSNESMAISQGKLLFWQIMTSIGLVVATCGLIYATWLGSK